MPAITVKNIPDDLYEHLRQSAEVNRRSINSEVIGCIERALRSRTISPEAVLARARRLCEKTVGNRIDDEEFAAAKTVGRL